MSLLGLGFSFQFSEPLAEEKKECSFSACFCRCQCGHCSALSSPLDSPVSMLAPFKPANTSHTKCCTCIPDAPVSSKWSNPAIGVPAFNPHLLISNDLHSIPPSQLLAPPPSLMMNGLGSGVPCGDSLEQREVEKSSEQVWYR